MRAMTMMLQDDQAFTDIATAEANPWRANPLEWIVPSPPPHGNFAEMPTVYRGAYEYGTPERTEDYWPQHLPA